MKSEIAPETAKKKSLIYNALKNVQTAIENPLPDNSLSPQGYHVWEYTSWEPPKSEGSSGSPFLVWFVLVTLKGHAKSLHKPFHAASHSLTPRILVVPLATVGMAIGYNLVAIWVLYVAFLLIISIFDIRLINFH